MLGRETFADNEYMHTLENLIFSGLIHSGESSVITTLRDKIHTGQNFLLIISMYMLGRTYSLVGPYILVRILCDKHHTVGKHSLIMSMCMLG